MPELVIGAWKVESLIGNGFRPYGLGINENEKWRVDRVNFFMAGTKRLDVLNE